MKMASKIIGPATAKYVNEVLQNGLYYAVDAVWSHTSLAGHIEEQLNYAKNSCQTILAQSKRSLGPSKGPRSLPPR